MLCNDPVKTCLEADRYDPYAYPVIKTYSPSWCGLLIGVFVLTFMSFAGCLDAMAFFANHKTYSATEFRKPKGKFKAPRVAIRFDIDRKFFWDRAYFNLTIREVTKSRGYNSSGTDYTNVTVRNIDYEECWILNMKALCPTSDDMYISGDYSDPLYRYISIHIGPCIPGNIEGIKCMPMNESMNMFYGGYHSATTQAIQLFHRDTVDVSVLGEEKQDWNIHYFTVTSIGHSSMDAVYRVEAFMKPTTVVYTPRLFLLSKPYTYNYVNWEREYTYYGSRYSQPGVYVAAYLRVSATRLEKTYRQVSILALMHHLVGLYAFIGILGVAARCYNRRKWVTSDRFTRHRIETAPRTARNPQSPFRMARDTGEVHLLKIPDASTISGASNGDWSMTTTTDADTLVDKDKYDITRTKDGDLQPSYKTNELMDSYIAMNSSVRDDNQL